jgi:hypothetical protein
MEAGYAEARCSPLRVWGQDLIIIVPAGEKMAQREVDFPGDLVESKPVCRHLAVASVQNLLQEDLDLLLLVTIFGD